MIKTYKSTIIDIINFKTKASIKDLILFLIQSVLLLALLWFGLILIMAGLCIIDNSRAGYYNGYGFAGAILIPMILGIVHSVPLVSIIIRLFKS